MLKLSQYDKRTPRQQSEKGGGSPFSQMPSMSALGVCLCFFCVSALTLYAFNMLFVIMDYKGESYTVPICTYLLDCVVITALFCKFGWWKEPFTTAPRAGKAAKQPGAGKKKGRGLWRAFRDIRLTPTSPYRVEMLADGNLYLVVSLMAAAALFPVLWIDGLIVVQDEVSIVIHEQMLARPVGLVAVLLAYPLVDEVTTHGAMLRTLLDSISQKREFQEGFKEKQEDCPPKWKTALGVTTSIFITAFCQCTTQILYLCILLSLVVVGFICYGKCPPKWRTALGTAFLLSIPAVCYYAINFSDVYLFLSLIIAGWIYCKVGSVIPCVLFRAVLELGRGVLIFFDMNPMRQQVIDILGGSQLMLCAVLTVSVLVFSICVYLILTRIGRKDMYYVTRKK